MYDEVPYYSIDGFLKAFLELSRNPYANERRPSPLGVSLMMS